MNSFVCLGVMISFLSCCFCWSSSFMVNALIQQKKNPGGKSNTINTNWTVNWTCGREFAWCLNLRTPPSPASSSSQFTRNKVPIFHCLLCRVMILSVISLMVWEHKYNMVCVVSIVCLSYAVSPPHFIHLGAHKTPFVSLPHQAKYRQTDLLNNLHATTATIKHGQHGLGIKGLWFGQIV